MTVLSFRNAAGKEASFGAGRIRLIEATGLECSPVAIAVSKGPAVEGAIAVKARNEARMIEVRALGGLSRPR